MVTKIVTDQVLASRAAEICGCAPGKVGYFIHGHCACSGDPPEPPYESQDTLPDVEGSAVAEVDAAPIENNNHELDTRKPKGICLKNCNRYWRAERQRDGSCKCVEQITDWHREKRAPSFTPEQGLALVNDDPLFMWYYATNPTQGELKCVVYKECTTKKEPNPFAPIRGTVNTEGHCVCAPKSKSSWISLTCLSRQWELYMHGEGALADVQS